MSKITPETVKQFLSAQGLEEDFLKAAGLNSLDELHPKNFESEVPTPSVVMKPTTSAATVPPKALPKSSADAATGFTPQTASDMLRPYIGLKVNYAARKGVSTYAPSSLMMDYIVHLINDLLCDNFYFKRACPDYHPYVIRLYYGVLFWIQVLRAGIHARIVDFEGHQLVTRFLSSFPPESLPISGPLLDLFKTLCCSAPEVPTYGIIAPSLPVSPGPARRDSFMAQEPIHHVLPNVPGIFALLDDLQLKLCPAAGTNPVFPTKGGHIPVPAAANAATIFGHHSFPTPDARTNFERWSLVSSGLQYGCEADKKLHENFAERIQNFQFPTTRPDDNLTSFANFLGLSYSMAWFAHVRDVAATEASFFNGSGTLADCPPFGVAANQILVQYQAPAVAVTPPTRSSDPLSHFPFSIKLRTNRRSVAELSEAMSATAQTHVEMYATHPYYARIGAESRQGPIWDVEPYESSITDESSYYSINEIVRGLMKPKG